MSTWKKQFGTKIKSLNIQKRILLTQSSFSINLLLHMPRFNINNLSIHLFSQINQIFSGFALLSLLIHFLLICSGYG